MASDHSHFYSVIVKALHTFVRVQLVFWCYASKVKEDIIWTTQMFILEFITSMDIIITLWGATLFPSADLVMLGLYCLTNLVLSKLPSSLWKTLKECLKISRSLVTKKSGNSIRIISIGGKVILIFISFPVPTMSIKSGHLAWSFFFICYNMKVRLLVKLKSVLNWCDQIKHYLLAIIIFCSEGTFTHRSLCGWL